MIAVNIVGFKNTGKTTVAEALGEELKRRGVRAAAAKFSHHDAVDVQDTDSERLRKAYGSCALLTPNAAALSFEGRRYLPDLMPMIDADVLVVEGGKSLGWLPRILLLRSVADAGALEDDLALASYGEVAGYGLDHAVDIEQLADIILERGFALAGLDCGACGYEDCATLARKIVAGKATGKACKARYSSVEVTVAGQPLGMNAFVEQVFSGAVVGMLREFKGFAPGDIEIRIKGK